jgi:hypothetical protein
MEPGVFSGALPAPLNGGGLTSGLALGGPVGAPFRLTATGGGATSGPEATNVEPTHDPDVPSGVAGVAPVSEHDEAGGTPWAGLSGDELAVDALPQLVRKPWRRLVRAITALGDDPADEELHDIRIRAKRLRYACEAVAVVVGKPAARLAKDAATLQGVLGDQHDAVVAEEWLREASRGAKGVSALVAGQLIAGERAAQRLGREEWGEPARRVTSPEHRVWLRRGPARRIVP